MALKNIFAGILIFCMMGVVKAEVIAPDVLIRNTVREVTDIVLQDKAIQAGDQEKILQLVDSKVLPHFDFKRMTQLAVGKYWRTATPQQREALITEFRNMLVRTYTKVFTVYKDQKVDVKPLRMNDSDTEVTVKTGIGLPGTATTQVDYEMKKAVDGWKVFDISIEGVSMVLSYRGTFTSEIQEGGIDGLIKTLSDKNSNAINLAQTKGQAQ